VVVADADGVECCGDRVRCFADRANPAKVWRTLTIICVTLPRWWQTLSV
jgi:hypothetical protein